MRWASRCQKPARWSASSGTPSAVVGSMNLTPFLTHARAGYHSPLSRWWIVRRHIWSKVLPTVAVTTAHLAAAVLLSVSSLTFLGIGVKPPAPTWGGMLSSDLGFLSQQPWAPLIPALAIALCAGALNAIADAIRDTTGAAAVPTPGRRRFARRVTRIGSAEPAAAVGAGVGAAPAVTVPAQEEGSHA